MCSCSDPTHSDDTASCDRSTDLIVGTTGELAERSAQTGQSAVVLASTRAYGATVGDIRLAHTDSHAVVAPGPWVGPSREAREEIEEMFLAPGATRARGAGTRALPEEADERRTCFERDLDRIKYSKAFRRLAGKCQVVLAPDDSHLRTRMTHALEVAQVALSVAQAVGLNQALVEAMALGHDCGHGPGGHAAEDAFELYVPGGYDHATWGANVTLTPLNLCVETLDGIRQHSWRLAAPATAEGELLSWSDRCAYLAHDADDAIRSGIIAAADLPRSVRELCGTRQSTQIRAFVGALIRSIETTGKVGMDEEMARALDDFRRFNYERIYMRPACKEQNEKTIAMLRALVELYADAPWKIPAVARGKVEVDISGGPAAVQAAVAYVSGMTDWFAISQAKGLLGWTGQMLPRWS